MTQSHLYEPVPYFKSILYDAPAWFEEFVLVCTEKNRDRRYDSAADVVTYLERRMADTGMLGASANDEPPWMRALGRLVFGRPTTLSSAA